MAPSLVVAPNHAVAVTMTEEPATGLAWIDRIDGLDHYYLFHAAWPDLLRQLDCAAAAYRRAHELVTNPADRPFLAGTVSAPDCSP